jgi:hypothetical protein
MVEAVVIERPLLLKNADLVLESGDEHTGYWFELGCVLVIRGFDPTYSYFAFVPKEAMLSELKDIIGGGQFEIERGQLPEELRE